MNAIASFPKMHLSIALFTALPLGALAYGGAVIRSKPQQPQVPEWAKQCNGKCTFTKTSTRTVWGTKTKTLQHKPATTSTVIIETSTSTSTLAQDTSIFSTTTVLYTTSTVTSSVTDSETLTITTTTTEAPTTTTIGAPAGFTPVKSVFPGGSAPVKRHNEDRKQKQPSEPEVHVHDIKKCTSSKFSTVYKTESRTRTSTVWRKGSTVTSTATSTVTTVTSVLPTPASSTVTVESTSTLSSVSIVATTTTLTVTNTATELAGPTPTFYAACSDDNILTNIDGQYVSALYYGNGATGGSMNLGTFTSAYQCCVACLNNVNCKGAGYIAGSICIGATSQSTCDGSVQGPRFGATGQTNVGWAVSNSPCGQWGRQS